MCYRYSNVQEEKSFRDALRQIRNAFYTGETGGRFSFYHTNGFAHELLPVITQENPNDISYMYWGLIPAGTRKKEDKEKSWKMGYTLNARAEDIFTTWSFKENIKKRRCLVPATGFFEWREFYGIKFPYLIQVKANDEDTEPFCFAGVYDRWVNPDGWRRNEF